MKNQQTLTILSNGICPGDLVVISGACHRVTSVAYHCDRMERPHWEVIVVPVLWTWRERLARAWRRLLWWRTRR